MLLTSADKPGLITDVVATTAETATAKKDDIAAFVRAWYKAVDYSKSNPDDANAIMAKGVGGWLEDPKVFAETLGGIEYLDKAKNIEFFGTAAALRDKSTRPWVPRLISGRASAASRSR